jgi:hypothetical protein
MLPTDKPKFLAVLNGLAAIKPGAKLTAEALTLYWNALSAWTIEDFTAAASQLARTCEFMPNPYHFEQLRKASRMTAGEAWTKALEYARCNGFSRWNSGPPSEDDPSQRPADPLIDAAVRAVGGYQAIAMTKTSDTHWIEKRFCEHYDAILEREDVRAAVPQIAGPTRHIDGPQSVAKLLRSAS